MPFPRLVATEAVDFIELSLRDMFKAAADDQFAPWLLLELFTVLDPGSVRLAVAGPVNSGPEVSRALDLSRWGIHLPTLILGGVKLPTVSSRLPGLRWAGEVELRHGAMVTDLVTNSIQTR